MTETISTLTVTKPINLLQLQHEMTAAGVAYGTSLLLTEDTLACYDAQGQVIGFPNPAAAQTVLDAHVGMRDKTDAELATEFQDPNTTPARRQEIRDMQAGLLPREQVPMDPSVPQSAPAQPPPSPEHLAIEAAAGLDDLKAALLRAIP